MLDCDGPPLREALTRFREAVGDRDLYSDSPEFDDHWLSMLANATGVSSLFVAVEVDGSAADCLHALDQECRREHASANFVREVFRRVLDPDRP